MSKAKKRTEEVHQTKKVWGPKSLFREYFESFATTLVMALFGMTFVLQAVTVPTGSMQNTILIGDYLLVNKFIFAPGGKPVPFLAQREVQRGDIIVFKYPGNKADPGEDRKNGHIPFQMNYVKRVIGMPGDTVEFRNAQVFINGQLLPEHRVMGDPPLEAGEFAGSAALETKEFEPRKPEEKYDVFYSSSTVNLIKQQKPMEARGTFGIPGKNTKVPDDSYFVMGDSRDNSLDGRAWGWVHRDLIIGRAMFVYWSCDRSNGSMVSCLTHPRFDRIGKMIK